VLCICSHIAFHGSNRELHNNSILAWPDEVKPPEHLSQVVT